MSSSPKKENITPIVYVINLTCYLAATTRPELSCVSAKYDGQIHSVDMQEHHRADLKSEMLMVTHRRGVAR